MKLPVFYLLDATSKDAYDSSVSPFGPVVANLFIEMHTAVVDPRTRCNNP